MTSIEKRRVDAYVDTIDRMEPDITHVDASAFYASAAISLKRMADAAEQQAFYTRLFYFVACVVLTVGFVTIGVLMK